MNSSRCAAAFAARPVQVGQTDVKLKARRAPNDRTEGSIHPREGPPFLFQPASPRSYDLTINSLPFVGQFSGNWVCGGILINSVDSFPTLFLISLECSVFRPAWRSNSDDPDID